MEKQSQSSEITEDVHLDRERFAADLFSIVRLFGVFSRDQACQSSVSVAQCWILQELLNGQREVSALAKFAGISPSAASRLLDSLERSNYIMRMHDTRDRRRVLLNLTETGIEEAKKLHAMALGYVGHIASLLPREEVATIERALTQLREAMNQAAARGVKCGDLIATE
ncbi:MAG: MarR family transcriptional regulator [Proteobacteria bacterium]|nr:MarR family transcriptional regulator [Pseudomonadota bacterium]